MKYMTSDGRWATTRIEVGTYLTRGGRLAHVSKVESGFRIWPVVGSIGFEYACWWEDGRAGSYEESQYDLLERLT